MTHEIRLRVPRSFYAALSTAAAMRGIAISALASQIIYDTLRERGELAPTQADAKPTPKPTPKPEVDLSEWLDDDEEPLNVGD